jgi:hypothetical protein
MKGPTSPRYAPSTGCVATEGLSRERRNQLVHPAHLKPELQATAPNQVWSWDITRLRSTMKWQYFCLYVLLIVEMTSMMSAAAGESTWGNSNGRFGSIHPPGDAGVEPYYEPIRAQISGADRVELVLVAR